MTFPYWGRVKKKLIARLVEAYPSHVEIHRLVSALYGGDIDGGPDEAERSIKMMVSQLRKLLKPYGWTIENRSFGGGGWAEYRLASIGE